MAIGLRLDRSILLAVVIVYGRMSLPYFFGEVSLFLLMHDKAGTSYQKQASYKYSPFISILGHADSRGGTDKARAKLFKWVDDEKLFERPTYESK